MKTAKIEGTINTNVGVAWMWKKWRKRVSNLFFEEITEDEEQENIKSDKRLKVKNQSKVNTKVTYQYPKKDHQSPFRFPVIPDEQTRTPVASKRKLKKYKKVEKRKWQPNHNNKDGLIYGYKGKKINNELEEIPAYMRRNNKKSLERKVESEQELLRSKESHADPLAGSTRPDELDRVFRKRDGKVLTERITSKKNSNLVKETFPRTVNKKPQTNSELVTSNVKRQEEVGKVKKPARRVRANVSESRLGHSVQPKRDKDYLPNHLLNEPEARHQDDRSWLQEQQSLLEQTLTHFKINANIVHVTQGPSVTRFEIQPALGVKVSRIRNLADDIKLNMAAKEIRIEAPIPGKNTIGIEVPNQFPQIVTLQEVIETEDFTKESSPLAIALGLTIEGKPLITNIEKMPHGLIAGSTGSGKSVCINTILLSLLYKSSAEEVKFLLIDPKMVELTPYNGIPHLIAPVITDPQAATMALKWAVNEMEERYEKFVDAKVRNVVKYNEKMKKNQRMNDILPYIVIVIDELADLMIASPQEVEDAICRIAQKARASGIHLLLATQRPSVDVITGLIKANIPTRIAFSVSSQVDSRTIIDENGAEKLLGRGDMLFVENGSNKRIRLQGPFVSDEEVDRVARYLRTTGEPEYLFEEEQLLMEIENEDVDELLKDVISFVLEQNQASTSLLQRRFRIGYNRAARLIDTLQSKGIISAQNGSKPRDVLVTKAQVEELISEKTNI